MRLVVDIAIAGLAVLAAALLVPGITLELGEEPSGALLVLLGIATVFGLGERLVRPLAGRLASPLRLLTLGLFSAAVKGALLLVVAVGLEASSIEVLTIGGFPPDLDLAAVVAAAAAGIIIAAISTMMAIVIRDP